VTINMIYTMIGLTDSSWYTLVVDGHIAVSVLCYHVY